MTFASSSEIFSDVIVQLLADIDTPLSLKAVVLIRHGEYVQLVNMTIDPSAYEDPESFFKDYQVVSLLRKCVDLPTGVDLNSEAKKAWYAAEKQCYRTNVRFTKHLGYTPFEGPKDLAIDDFLKIVRGKVRKLMGPVPSELFMARHGPGATLMDRGQLTTAPDKMSSRPTCTTAARCLLPFWGETAWARGLMQDFPDRSDPLELNYDRFAGVPKDAMKNRGICVGPSLNTFYQLGVGRHLKRRLSQHGYDLKDGQNLHRRVAKWASEDGSYATIDLSSASDTVSRNLVRFLLEDTWLEVLETLRVPSTKIDGALQNLQKFSAMGNGYTFELETIIFSAICESVMEHSGLTARPGRNIFVYGDDLILPSDCCRNLLSVLSYCGFTPNKRKTYLDGPFRESCGGDFFLGKAVRPHFIEELPTEPQHWISLANGLRRAGFCEETQAWYRPYFKRAWFACLKQLPSPIRRLRGPSTFGDVLIHDTEDRWAYRERNCIRYFRAYVPFVKKVPLDHFSPSVQLASALYGVPSSGVAPRDSVDGYRILTIPRQDVEHLERPINGSSLRVLV